MTRIKLNARQIADVLKVPADEFAHTRLTRKQHTKVIAENTEAQLPAKPAVDLADSVSWKSVWAFEFGERASGVIVVYIPPEGLTIAVPVPKTPDKITVGFATIEYPGQLATAGKIEYNISKIAGDRTSQPVRLIGTRAGAITGGVNLSGMDVTLASGSTHFWNLRFPSGEGYLIHLQYAYRKR